MMKALTTELIGRNLRFDGVSEIEPGQLPRFLLLGVPPSKLRVTEETEEVREMNEQVLDEDKIRVVQPEAVNIDLSWQLPEKYAKLDLTNHLVNILLDRQASEPYPQAIFEAAALRVQVELDEVERRGMTEFMRTVIFILDELRKHSVVWGVGRGSSCASYLLFLIGLHVVDCVTMDVPLAEFYHD